MSRRRPDPNEPVDLDKEFGIAVESTNEGVSPPVPVPTGLSDEEDAQRHLALRFNSDLQYCPNCETPVVRPTGGQSRVWCEYCGDTLREMGTAPRKKKLPQQ